MSGSLRLLWLCALLLGAAGCNFDSALSTYCQETGLCQCEGDACCGGPGAPCLDGCCGRLICGEDGLCTTGSKPTLRIEPSRHDFGERSPGAPGADPEQLFVVTNAGDQSTVALSTALTEGVAGAFTLLETDCNGKVLAPGAHCSARVRFSAVAAGPMGERRVRLLAEEPVSVEGWKLQGSSELVARQGEKLTVSVKGSGSVRSEPAGIDCGYSCSSYFPSHVPLTLVGSAQPGNALHWSGCAQVEGERCTVDLQASGTVSLEVRPWLQVRVEHPEGLPLSSQAVRTATAGIACGGNAYDDCSEATTAPVVLVAQPPPGWAFLGWDGACTGDALECPLAMQGPSEVVARFSPYNHMFVLSGVPLDTLQADLSGADGLCASRVPLGVVPNTYRAWLSVEGRPAAERLRGARGWLRMGDSRPFADTVEDLEAGTVLSAPGGYSGNRAATGRLANGPAERCGDWTTISGSHAPGSTMAGHTTWQRDEALAPQGCSQLASIYCFGTRYYAPLRVERQESRIAFLSSPWVPAGGLAGADAHCNADAADAGLGGSFRALLSVQGTEAWARLEAGLTWTRVDGVEVGLQNPGSSAPSGMRVPLNVTADGRYLGSSGRAADGTLVWTGGHDDVAAADETCNGWQGEGTGRVGRPEFVDATHQVFSTVSCATAQRLYCAQR